MHTTGLLAWRLGRACCGRLHCQHIMYSSKCVAAHLKLDAWQSSGPLLTCCHMIARNCHNAPLLGPLWPCAAALTPTCAALLSTQIECVSAVSNLLLPFLLPFACPLSSPLSRYGHGLSRHASSLQVSCSSAGLGRAAASITTRFAGLQGSGCIPWSPDPALQLLAARATGGQGG